MALCTCALCASLSVVIMGIGKIVKMIYTDVKTHQMLLKIFTQP